MHVVLVAREADIC